MTLVVAFYYVYVFGMPFFQLFANFVFYMGILLCLPSMMTPVQFHDEQKVILLSVTMTDGAANELRLRFLKV